MRINKHDTQGTKPLLGKGELGYDDYTAGGDVGRVYVGTGTENIPIAKKTEVDAHIARVDNPHGVTKAQVGLWLVDNTADASKNVLSATKWATARTIALSGDVAGSASVDGSANVTITTTVQPNSVTLGTDTIGNYVAGATAGAGISISGTAGEGWSPTITNTAPNVTTDITTTHNATNVVVNSSDGTDGTINGATQTLAGVMTAADKTKLDGIAAGAQVNVATNLGSSGTGATRTITSSTGSSTSITYSAADVGAAAVNATVNLTGNQTVAGDKTFSGLIIGRTPTVVTDLSSLTPGTPSIVTSDVAVPNTGTQYAPMIHGSSILNGAGYRQHVSLGHKRTPGSWGNFYIAVGGNDGYPTKEWLFHGGTGDFVSPGTITAPTFTGALNGNAGTATTLQTARTISGVSFNGSANIDIEDRLGTAIASAATTTIGTRGLGDYIHITGTTTITSFGTAAAAGVRRTLIFDGALTLTHNATSLICPGAANIVTVAGTIIEVVAETTANWRVVSITHPSLSMAELSYLDGVTSAIQTQLNAKAALASPALTGTPTAPTAASTVSSTQIATTAFAVPRTSTTGSARLPVGTTEQRDASPVDGMIRYNSTTMGFEGFFNGQWQSVGGGQMFGNAIVKAVSYNAQTINENITVTAGLNAYSVGDITINNGYTMTIENGSVYKIL